MPMGQYKDFASCVRANQSKRDPDAYCGSIYWATEGREEKALDAARVALSEIQKLFGRKPTAPKGPVQNPQPQGIPAKVYQGKGFTGVAPAQRRPGIPHPGLARGAGRVAKHELSSDAPQWGWHQRGPIAPPPKPKGSVKKNGGGTEEATPELADVTMIGRTLQSVSDILSEHAKEHHDLDKKKSKKTSFAQRGRALQPGRKPHGQTKPRQQRGTAHGQRIAKHETGEPHDDCETITRRVAKHQTEVNPAHSHGPQGSATSYAARSEAGREQARQESRRRPRQHNSEDEGLQIAREKRRMQKQHPDEYPEEWGPDELYQKIGEETDEIKKAMGCPAGQHTHPPYDFCHNMRQVHGGETRVEEAGGLEAAHGVLDEAIVQAHALGAKPLAAVLTQAKGRMPHDPDAAYQALAATAQLAEEKAKGLSSPRERAYYLALAKILKQAAAKVKPQDGAV